MTNRDEIARRVVERLRLRPIDYDWWAKECGEQPRKVWDALISSVEQVEKAEARVGRLEQELKDLRDETRWNEVERSRNADKFSREGY